MALLNFCTIFSLLLFGLNTKLNSQKINFPIERSITPNIVEVPPVIYAQTPGVVLSGNYLVVMRSFSNPLYSVFEVPDCKYLGDFGNLGRGPKEFEIPDARTATETERGFKIFDAIKGLLYVDITNFSINKKFTVNQLKLPGELIILNDPIQLNDSLIYGLPYVGKSEKLFVKYNIKSSEVSYFGEYPSFYPKKNREQYWGLLWRHSIVKPDKTKFAIFFDHFKMFRLYNSSETLEKEVIMEIPDNLFNPKRKSGNLMIYYSVVKATDEYIYALCMNEHLDELVNSNPTIEIWDWNGNPIAKLYMKNSIFSFDVTNDNKKLYCIDRQITDKIFIYNLNFKLD